MKRTAHITTFTDETGRLEIAYDALHRLVGSSGAGAGNSYGMAVEYSPSGRIKEKRRWDRGLAYAPIKKNKKTTAWDTGQSLVPHNSLFTIMNIQQPQNMKCSKERPIERTMMGYV